MKTYQLKLNNDDYWLGNNPTICKDFVRRHLKSTPKVITVRISKEPFEVCSFIKLIYIYGMFSWWYPRGKVRRMFFGNTAYLLELFLRPRFHGHTFKLYYEVI